MDKPNPEPGLQAYCGHCDVTRTPVLVANNACAHTDHGHCWVVRAEVAEGLLAACTELAAIIRDLRVDGEITTAGLPIEDGEPLWVAVLAACAAIAKAGGMAPA